MTKAVEKILEEIKALPNEECADLLDQISIIRPSLDPEYKAAWEAELQERIEAVERGEVKLVPWREAMKMIGRDEENEKQSD